MIVGDNFFIFGNVFSEDEKAFLGVIGDTPEAAMVQNWYQKPMLVNSVSVTSITRRERGSGSARKTEAKDRDTVAN